MIQPLSDVAARCDRMVCPSTMEELISELFDRVGCEREEARKIGHLLIRANLRGHDSHGIVRVNRYVNWVSNGTLVPNQHVTILSDVGARLELDGNYGFGQAIGEEAMLLGIEKARDHGVSIVSLRHSGHLGVIGDWANLVAKKGFISLHMVNVRGSLLVAPYGGISRRASTAPFCAGVPRNRKSPLLIDFATSTVAEGKALVALKRGSALPKGSLITSEGSLTSQPEHLYGETAGDAYPDARSGTGALTSFGQHKGNSLNFLMELLGGALTGSGVAGHTQDEKRTICNGMFTIIIDPTTMNSADYFKKELEDYCCYIRSTKPVDGYEKVLLPGEKEEITMERRLREGIPIPPQTLQDIVSVLHEYKILVKETDVIQA